MKLVSKIPSKDRALTCDALWWNRCTSCSSCVYDYIALELLPYVKYRKSPNASCMPSWTVGSSKILHVLQWSPIGNVHSLLPHTERWLKLPIGLQRCTCNILLDPTIQDGWQEAFGDFLYLTYGINSSAIFQHCVDRHSHRQNCWMMCICPITGHHRWAPCPWQDF